MKTEIIAEIAQGYEGNSKLAELLVKGALVAGADSVKLQLVYADEICVPSYPYHAFFTSLEMPDSVWQTLVSKVHEVGKLIYFDVYGMHSLALAKKFGADGVKISTTDFHNLRLLKQAFVQFPKVFISIGGIPLHHVDELVNTIAPQDKLILMHGFQAEPTAVKETNLARIKTLTSRYEGVKIGFMDHSLGNSPEAFQLPLLAMGIGVNCIEKHITLDYSLQIEDYVSALSVDRFSKFVSTVRAIEPALGSEDLTLTQKEVEYGERAGKILVASRDLPHGHVVTEDDIDMKRVGMVPVETQFRRASDIIGKSLSHPIARNCPYERRFLK